MAYRIDWTPARLALLTRLWNRGTQVKAIAAEMGFDRSTIYDQRKAMGLPARRPEVVHMKHLTVRFDDALWAALNRAAFDRYATPGEYIRALVRKDVGMQRE